MSYASTAEEDRKSEQINSSCCCMKTCGASEALVRSGACVSGGTSIKDGGALWVIPCCQMVQKLDLSIMSLQIRTPEVNDDGSYSGPIIAGGKGPVVYTKDGVPVRANSVAQVRIGPPPEIGGDEARRDEKLRYLQSAASIFGGLKRSKTKEVITKTLEGHQRSMIGNMFAKELLLDRAKFADEVNRSATVDLIGMGVWITSYQLMTVTDEEGYINSLGVPETESKKQKARKDSSEQRSLAKIKEFEQSKESTVKKLRCQIDEETAKTKNLLTQAKNSKAVNVQKAIADLSQKMTETRIRKQLVTDQQNVKMEEKKQEIQVARAEVERKKQELQASVIVPAEAECFKITKDAEAEAFKITAQADADSEKIRLEGEAEAYSQRVRGEAEAEAMVKKAKAWGEYSRATFLDKIIEQLPEITKQVSKSLSSAESITMVSNSSTGGGANKLAREVTDALATMPAAVEAIAGKEMSALLSDYLK